MPNIECANICTVRFEEIDLILKLDSLQILIKYFSSVYLLLIRIFFVLCSCLL